MTKLKSIRLKNYCGYRDKEFNFCWPLTDDIGPGKVKALAVIFGPNGAGKTNLLESIRMVSNPGLFDGRSQGADLYIRKSIYNEDYDPDSANISMKTNLEMEVEAIFEVDDENKRVVLGNRGFKVCELPSIHNGHAYYCDADSTLTNTRFQLMEKLIPDFTSLAETIYGHKVSFGLRIMSNLNGEKVAYVQDMILHKGTVKVHFARFSAGEKKIATMLRQLLNPDNTENRDVLIIDNMDLHVYFRRHIIALKSIRDYFPNKQIIVTTHSGDIVRNTKKGYLYDLEE